MALFVATHRGHQSLCQKLISSGNTKLHSSNHIASELAGALCLVVKWSFRNLEFTNTITYNDDSITLCSMSLVSKAAKSHSERVCF